MYTAGSGIPQCRMRHGKYQYCRPRARLLVGRFARAQSPGPCDRTFAGPQVVEDRLRGRAGQRWDKSRHTSISSRIKPVTTPLHEATGTQRFPRPSKTLVGLPTASVWEGKGLREPPLPSEAFQGLPWPSQVGRGPPTLSKTPGPSNTLQPSSLRGQGVRLTPRTDPPICSHTAMGPGDGYRLVAMG